MSESEQKLKDVWIDPDDAPELTDEMLERAVLKVNDIPVSKEEFVAAFKAKRGRPIKPDPKIPTTIRLSPEVVERFRATGDGWQTRIDAALKEWAREHPL